MSFKVLNFSSVTMPKAIESPSKEWVLYGEDNDYFQYLIDRYNGSAVNNAIISSVSDQIYGEGLSATNSDKHPLDYAKMRTIFKGEDLKRVAGDLKLLGQGAFNTVWNKGRTEVLKAKHIPMQNLRPEKATDGEIKGWWYSDNWKESRKEIYKPKRFEAFTGARGKESQILVIKPYAAGFFYFSPVDYAGALKWAEIDEEIADYHLSNIQNGFAPTMMVNFNNGLPTEDEQNVIERKVENKLQGATGKKWLLSFNDDNSNATTIDSLPISEASEQYKFLSEEATKKILVGHKVTSPMLFGIKDATGFGNNADEIKVASQLWDNTVIKPKQNDLLAAINDVLAVNGIVLDTYFKTLQPIEFIETEGLSTEEIEKETGVDSDGIAEGSEVIVSDDEIEQVEASYNGAQISSAIDIIAKVKEGILTQAQAITFLIQFLQLPNEIARGFFDDVSINTNLSKMFSKKPFLSDEFGDELLDELELIGEENNPDEWELISEEVIDTTQDGFHQFANALKSDAKPNEKSSYGDVGLYKVRYVYSKTSKKTPTGSSRKFCTRMLEMASSGLEYRYEDIENMSDKGVNSQFSPKGSSTYNLFKYKGGVNCYHGWMRRIYFRKRGANGRILPNKGMDNERRVGNNPYIKQKGAEAKAPIDTPSKGRK